MGWALVNLFCARFARAPGDSTKHTVTPNPTNVERGIAYMLYGLQSWDETYDWHRQDTLVSAAERALDPNWKSVPHDRYQIEGAPRRTVRGEWLHPKPSSMVCDETGEIFNVDDVWGEDEIRWEWEDDENEGKGGWVAFVASE